MASSAHPAREEMTLLWGRHDREIRAAVVDGRLLILVYDRYDEAGLSEWHPDPECGVFLPPEGLSALRALLAVSP